MWISIFQLRGHVLTCPVVCFCSENRKYLLMGLENGGIRVQEAEEGDVSKLGASYTINTHDNDYGRVMHIATSFDHRLAPARAPVDWNV